MDHAFSKVSKRNETVKIIHEQAKEYNEQQRVDLDLNQKMEREILTLQKNGLYLKPPQEADG